MKILCTYKPIEQPWGGANNFLRALYGELQKSGVTITFDCADSYDLIFMNQLSPGRGQDREAYTLEEVQKIKSRNPAAPLIVRTVNLRRHSHPSLFYRFSKDYIKDKNTISHIGMADHVIFQSQYQHNFFSRFGAQSKSHTIIHNGASSNFLGSNPSKTYLRDHKLCIVSSSFARGAQKRHDLIARLSEIDNVEVKHLGAWPDKVDKKNVECLGVIEHSAMMEVFKEAHYFAHPAIKDVCPNSMVEALCAGVPVLYNPDIGSGKELGAKHGIAIDVENLQGTIEKAKSRYNDLVEDLAEKRRQYSIQGAAEKYLNCFQSALNCK